MTEQTNQLYGLLFNSLTSLPLEIHLQKAGIEPTTVQSQVHLDCLALVCSLIELTGENNKNEQIFMMNFIYHVYNFECLQSL